MRAFAIDAFDFCRLRERAEGEVAIAELGRLAAEGVDASGVLQWSLHGDADQFGHTRLRLSVTGTMQLMCQRCLTPFAHRIATQSVLILAPDEDAADSIEELLQDDAVDVIVVAKQLDVMLLVEDDALLALPFAPKHENCPGQETVERLQGAKKPSPFAALKDLKQ
ncbi:MAG TPA: YceD family protein [Candidimonas sp.]|nr:YceD family protein [Candidimonas sp.]